ncbi:hypothetical protein T06_13694 [Trichinella sp. T6]|nr:hypothetical protein T06_13694 [Trichinella sp. T6]
MTAPVLCEDLWQTPVSPKDWPHLQSLNLTKEVGELTPVHVIIGLDSYFRFLGRQVIRGDPNLPRRQWALGRITELQDGIDGVARSARVKISNGMITRSVRSLILVDPAQSS